MKRLLLGSKQLSDRNRLQSALRSARAVPPLTAAGTRALALAFLFIAGAAAQQPLAPIDSNAVMGFENTTTWTVSGNSKLPGVLTSTTQRTQGNAAYSIANPPNQMKIVSQPIASTATALAGIGDTGALLQIDFLIPVQQGNLVNSGYIQPYVTSKSRNLSKVALPQVFLNNYRAGIYNTIGFAVPDAVRSALGGATYSDLTFEFDISSPGQVTGAYLLDNLRVHSVPLVQSPSGQPPPPGYGGSVNLDVFGVAPVAPLVSGAPVTGTFHLGPTQIPNGFHLKQGTVGSTTAQLQLGLDGTPTLTCTYGGDPNDPAHQSYILTSCGGGFQAGDLVNANWVSLAILGTFPADPTREIFAQLALNPLGDLAGSNLIPPMPTFWGNSDTCAPAPVTGTVVTFSDSCKTQTAQANKIINDYFTQVNNFKPAPNWIVPPVPDFGLRHGDGLPSNVSASALAPLTADPTQTFNTGGHLNQGGTFDAYWNLTGSLSPTAVPNTDENKTHFDATLGAHAVLFGEDVDVAAAKVTADTDSGETTPTYKAATSTGTVGLYVFGTQIVNETVNPSTGFSVGPTFGTAYNLPPIQIWIFSITLGATADGSLKASASAAVSGVDLSVTPSVTIGGHALGGINIGIASGGVDAKVNLLTVSTPVTAQAKWVIRTNPSLCDFDLQGSLTGKVTLSSGGGEIDLDATFGICPFCDTESQTLFKWANLASNTWTLFDVTINPTLFELPTSMCSFPVSVNIVSPANNANLSSGLPITLQGSAKPNDSMLPVANTTYTWTYTPGANASTTSGATTGANPVVTFGAPTSGSTSTWTIGLSATVTVTDSQNHPVTSTASATPATVTVSSLSTGVYISQVVSAVTGPGVPDSNGVIVVNNGDTGLGTVGTGDISISGLVQGIGGALNTTFTVASCSDVNGNYYTATCSSPGAATTLTTTNATTTSPSAIWPGASNGTRPAGTYKITMTTTDGGSHTATVLVWIPQVIG